MDIESSKKLCSELINVGEKSNLEIDDFFNYLLAFVIAHMSLTLDEEDAREWCRKIYASVVRAIKAREDKKK